jgi:hypothetical protein
MIRAETFAIQRRGKQASTATEGLFSARSVPKSYLEDPISSKLRVESGKGG